MSSNEFFNRFPKLESHLLSIVESSAANESRDVNPCLLPALLIIQRLIPTGTSRNENRFLTALFELVQNHVWKCRVSSARSFYALNSDPNMVYKVFEKLKSAKTSNSVHGLLLILDEFSKSQLGFRN